MGLLMVVQMDVMASICWMRALRRSLCPPSLASLSPSRWRQGAQPRLQHMSMHSVIRKWRMSLTWGPPLKKVKTVLSGSTSALRSRLCAAWEKLRAPSSLSLLLQARPLEPLCVGLGRGTQGYKLVRTSRTRTPIQMTWSSPSLLLTRPAMILQLTNVNVRKIRAPRRSATPHLVGSAPTPEPGPTEGAACYDITVHKCKCTAELCDRQKCKDAGMMWTPTCVPTDSTPVACTCDQFDGGLGGIALPPAPVGMLSETECAGYSETRCAAAASVGCVWEDGACS